ncbi:MAG: hypothetical protein HY617_01850 [Candidatus Sungbacteria bacterium]|nr:hypothetical protein [Candidatus Sungbacteria bacterium]
MADTSQRMNFLRDKTAALFNMSVYLIKETLNLVIWGQLRVCPACGEKALHLKINSILASVDTTVVAGAIPRDETVVATCIECGRQFEIPVQP